MKQQAIIVDLDDTLVDISHRRHMFDKPRYSEKEIEAAMAFDRINEWCLEICRFFSDNNYKIIFLTGRYGRDATEKYLFQHVGPGVDYVLVMRDKNDHKQDTVTKLRLYHEQVAPFYDVIFCIDDRTSITELWRDLGLVALQCSDSIK